MDFKGIFTPNNISMPQWRNKEGENEFDKMLSHLADIGKKLSALKKKADDFSAKMPTKEETVSVEHYDSTPRPLGEIFNSRNRLSDVAIAKARDIVSQQTDKMKLPASNIYLLKTDISRFAGDGTPATGRISFQIPFMTPQGDQRTVYADVDIVLGSLFPPRYFTDGINQKFAFSEAGLNEFLRGRDFEIMQNPKVAPETVYFETPGHLAGRGGMQVTKHAEDEVKQETDLKKVFPGDEEAKIIDIIKKAEANIKELEKGIKLAQEKLDEKVKTLDEYGTLTNRQKNLKEAMKAQKEALSQMEAVLTGTKNTIVEYEGRTYKLLSKMEKSKTPLYTAIVGKLISLFPKLKGQIDILWSEIRTITPVKSLLMESPTEETKEWEIRREAPQKPDVPIYKPPEKEASIDGLVKNATVIDSLEGIISTLSEIDNTFSEAGV